MNTSYSFSLGRELSEGIYRLRFPLMLGVILIHSTNLSSIEGCFAPDSGAAAALLLEEAITRFVLGPVVPLYFFISGFLFLHFGEALSALTYAAKLKKRFFSLLIPYIAWNLLAFLVRNIIKTIPFTAAFCGSAAPWENFTFYHLFVLPELVPLWFIRNLLLIVVLSPIVVAIVRRLRFFALVPLLFADYYCPYLSGLFYWALGVCVAMFMYERPTKPAMHRRLRGISILWAVCVLAETAVFVGGCATDYFSSGAYDIVQDYILSPMGLVGYILLLRKIKESVRLASSAFFIYLFHGIISSYVIKIVNMLRPESFFSVFGCYVLDFVLIAMVSILAYFACMKLAPALTKILVGNRIRPQSLPGQ